MVTQQTALLLSAIYDCAFYIEMSGHQRVTYNSPSQINDKLLYLFCFNSFCDGAC